MCNFKIDNKWLVPLILWILFTPISPWLDVKLTAFFYKMGEGTVEHFPVHPALQFIYTYALIPGQMLAVIAFLALILSYFFNE